MKYKLEHVYIDIKKNTWTCRWVWAVGPTARRGTRCGSWESRRDCITGKIIIQYYGLFLDNDSALHKK